MNFVIRVKHFDVLITNRTENMTSVDCITQLVDESEVNRKNGDLQLRKKPSSEEQLSSWKQSAKRSSELVLSFIFSKLLTNWYF